jgi:hypothetical protein
MHIHHQPVMVKEIEITEFEWYLRDHLFRRSNQGRERFRKEELGEEMSNLCFRYRNSNLEKLNELTDIVIQFNLISRQVLQQAKIDRSLQLTSRLSRSRCSKCYYISYLTRNELRKCLRCSSIGAGNPGMWKKVQRKRCGTQPKLSTRVARCSHTEGVHVEIHKSSVLDGA